MGAYLKVSQDSPTPEVLDAATAVLARGGVLVIPTDSVYGIGCVATSDNPAHRRIFEIKRRNLSQTLPWLIADPLDLSRFGSEVGPWVQRVAEAFWPGALTIVVKASTEVPEDYVAQDGTIALRVPDSTLVRTLARRVGPLATTSANTHGASAATSGESVESRIVSAADLTLDAGPAPIAVASTIVDGTGERLRILRLGAIAEEDLLRVASRR